MEEKVRSALLLSVVILLIAVVAWAQNAWITITSAEERKNKPHYLINGEVPLVNEYLSSFSPFSPLYCICCKTIMFPNNVLNSYICFLNKILKVLKENSHSSSLLSWILSTTFSNLTSSITLSVCNSASDCSTQHQLNNATSISDCEPCIWKTQHMNELE